MVSVAGLPLMPETPSSVLFKALASSFPVKRGTGLRGGAAHRGDPPGGLSVRTLAGSGVPQTLVIESSSLQAHFVAVWLMHSAVLVSAAHHSSSAPFSRSLPLCLSQGVECGSLGSAVELAACPSLL